MEIPKPSSRPSHSINNPEEQRITLCQVSQKKQGCISKKVERIS